MLTSVCGGLASRPFALCLGHAWSYRDDLRPVSFRVGRSHVRVRATRGEHGGLPAGAPPPVRLCSYSRPALAQPR